MKEKIVIGADHRGVKHKAKIVSLLGKLGYAVEDVGIFDDTIMCDYPGISLKVGTAVADNKNTRGILVCMTGIGHSIAANKIPGVYAALCYNKEAAALSRQHNNANVLILGAKFVPESEMYKIIKVWLSSEFEGGRHLRRTKQIKAIEKKYSKR